MVGEIDPSLADVVLGWPSPAKPLLLPRYGKLVSGDASHVRLPKAEEPVTVRFKASGMLHIVGRNGGRKLKNLAGVQCAAPLRDTTPLLFTVKH